jgi:hypothetical protein
MFAGKKKLLPLPLTGQSKLRHLSNNGGWTSLERLTLIKMEKISGS